MHNLWPFFSWSLEVWENFRNIWMIAFLSALVMMFLPFLFFLTLIFNKINSASEMSKIKNCNVFKVKKKIKKKNNNLEQLQSDTQTTALL